MDSTELLYHGSTVAVPSPEIRVTRYNKDFFFGFYCTRIRLGKPKESYEVKL